MHTGPAIHQLSYFILFVLHVSGYDSCLLHSYTLILHKLPATFTQSPQAASNIHTVSTSCQQHSHSLHKLPATFTQSPQAASNIHTASTSCQQHSHSLHKQPATFTQPPQAASNIHTVSTSCQQHSYSFHKQPATFTQPPQAASNIHTASTSCQQHSYSFHKQPATFTQPPQPASNIHTVSTSSQQHSHSLYKQPATFIQFPQAASNIHTASQKSHTLVAIRSQPLIHITSQKSSAQFSGRLTLPKPLHGLIFWFSRGKGGVGIEKKNLQTFYQTQKWGQSHWCTRPKIHTSTEQQSKQSPSVLHMKHLLKRSRPLLPESYLSVATFWLGADGKTEASAARYIRDHEKLQPLIPAWIGRLHHLAALGFTQRLCAMVDTGFDIDLKWKSNLVLVHKKPLNTAKTK